jgi:hypothetical protein
MKTRKIKKELLFEDGEREEEGKEKEEAERERKEIDSRMGKRKKRGKRKKKGRGGVERENKSGRDEKKKEVK